MLQSPFYDNVTHQDTKINVNITRKLIKHIDKPKTM